MTRVEPAPASPSANAIEASEVRLSIGSGEQEILDGVSLTVKEGEFTAIVGPSGCGKTTFLNMVAGLQPYTAGTITVRGAAPRAGRPDMAYALARDALLPWRNALDNVALALQVRGVGKAERRERAMQALSRVGLADAAHRHRSQLSQGMRQRVALARTFVTEPRMLILDEPFAALDAQTRIIMQDFLLRLLEQFSGTMLFVTHDIAEAITLADRVVVFSRRPATVLADHYVDIPRPRHASELRADSRFVELFETLWKDISSEMERDAS